MSLTYRGSRITLYRLLQRKSEMECLKTQDCLDILSQHFRGRQGMMQLLDKPESGDTADDEFPRLIQFWSESNKEVEAFKFLFGMHPWDFAEKYKIG